MASNEVSAIPCQQSKLITLLLSSIILVHAIGLSRNVSFFSQAQSFVWKNTGSGLPDENTTNSQQEPAIEVIVKSIGNGKEGHAQTRGLELKLDEFFGESDQSHHYFVESGAYDGITHSNTIWLERKRGWNGLLIEGNPNLAAEIRASGRSKSKLLEGCLATTNEVSKLEFLLAGPLGGIASNIEKNHEERIKKEIDNNEPWMNEESVGPTVQVTCYPLNEVLRTMKQDVVDFWSLDTEGSEVDILETVDFRRYTFGLIFIVMASTLLIGGSC